MNPKNYKNFYDDIAKESEVHKDLVSDFVFFFYDKVRKNLSNLTSPKIALPNLGTFSIRINKLKKNSSLSIYPKYNSIPPTSKNPLY